MKLQIESANHSFSESNKNLIFRVDLTAYKFDMINSKFSSFIDSDVVLMS